jgi:hypothetical protein
MINISYNGRNLSGKFYHVRKIKNNMLYNLGGQTRCVLTDVETKETFEGVAICSRRDNFCKKQGRTLALAKALINAKL